MNDLEYCKRRISELEEECVKKQNEINQLEESCGRMKARVATWVNHILPRATEEARKMIDNHQYVGIRIATCEEWANRGKDNNSEVEKYRKAFEDAKKEHDCQIAEYQKKIEELEKKSDFYFSEEPIKIADLMIYGWETSWDYKHFSVSELRQIAEHLLVYCNHNGEVEE